jgi:hypothetical protein|tara:strand:+ start:18 stop:266 length:249 start_codon:yes stop_codon:yes gene_type:complete
MVNTTSRTAHNPTNTRRAITPEPRGKRLGRLSIDVTRRHVMTCRGIANGHGVLFCERVTHASRKVAVLVCVVATPTCGTPPP